MSDFILSKHGKGKTTHYFYMENRPNGIKKISSSTFYRLSKILEQQKYSLANY
jgi:hypothetical protein